MQYLDETKHIMTEVINFNDLDFSDWESFSSDSTVASPEHISSQTTEDKSTEDHQILNDKMKISRQGSTFRYQEMGISNKHTSTFCKRKNSHHESITALLHQDIALSNFNKLKESNIAQSAVEQSLQSSFRKGHQLPGSENFRNTFISGQMTKKIHLLSDNKDSQYSLIGKKSSIHGNEGSARDQTINIQENRGSQMTNIPTHDSAGSQIMNTASHKSSNSQMRNISSQIIATSQKLIVSSQENSGSRTTIISSQESSGSEAMNICSQESSGSQKMNICSQESSGSQIMTAYYQESSGIQTMNICSQESSGSQKMNICSQESSGSQIMTVFSQESSGSQTMNIFSQSSDSEKMITSSQESSDNQKMITSSQESSRRQKMLISSQGSFGGNKINNKKGTSSQNKKNPNVTFNEKELYKLLVLKNVSSINKSIQWKSYYCRSCNKIAKSKRILDIRRKELALTKREKAIKNREKAIAAREAGVLKREKAFKQGKGNI